MKKPIPVFVIDDHKLFCDVLCSFIKGCPDFRLIGSFNRGDAFLEYLSRQDCSERTVAIMDINIAEMNGLETHNTIHRQYPNIHTVFLSSYYNGAIIRQVMDRQAGSFLVKNCNIEDLTEAIRQVYHFLYYLSDNVLKALEWKNDYPKLPVETQAHSKLTKREIEVLKLICLQMNSREIAEKLFLSLRTVENHRANLMIKTSSNNLAGLVSFAIRNDLYFPM